jgi:hypothetical protein
MRINFFTPLLMSVAFLIFGAVLPTIMPTVGVEWKYASLAVGVALLVATYFVAKNGSSTSQTRGGRGGKSSAPGENADAEGGAGGNANGGIGGDGGSALASGKGARAKGGAGGSG